MIPQHPIDDFCTCAGFAFAIYLAVGVALWRSWPWFRNTFHEAGYVGGMILTALIWPLALMMVAGIMVFFSSGLVIGEAVSAVSGQTMMVDDRNAQARGRVQGAVGFCSHHVPHTSR